MISKLTAIFSEFLKKLLRFIIRYRFYFILKPLYFLVIRKIYPERSIENISSNKINILALSPGIFRGDLEILSNSNEVNMYKIHHGWQRLITHAFYPKNTDATDYYRKSKPKDLIEAQNKLREFLTVLLTYLYSKIKIDIIVIPNVRYLEDLDWCFVSRSLGIKIVLMFREGLIMFRRGYEGTLNRHKMFGSFEGDHIIVHNQITRKMFIESGFAEARQISVNGMLRIDELIKKVNSEKYHTKNQITLFYFRCDKNPFGRRVSGSYVPPGVPCKIYKDTILCLIDLARSDASLNVVIKPKPKDFANGELIKFLEDNQVSLDQIPNVKILPYENVHDLIIESKVIIGLQTTAILEAAVANKPIIFPYFDEFRNSAWSKRFGYKKYLDLFSAASSKDDLEKKILSYMKKYTISNEVRKQRNNLIEKYLSSLSGNATSLYLRSLRGVINDNE